MIHPKNGNLLIRLVSQEIRDEPSELLLPEGYQARSEYEYGEILAIATDCTRFADFVDQGRYVVFPSNMLIEIPLDGETYCMVKENYVIGTYQREDD